jgi:hypothetical protein
MDNGQLFPNLVRECLPTIRELIAIKAFHGTDLAAPGSTLTCRAGGALWLLAPTDTRSPAFTRDPGTPSRPLHREGVNLLGTDIACEDRGTVRGDTDFGIPRRAGGTV